jgi:hypothetical protein
MFIAGEKQDNVKTCRAMGEMLRGNESSRSQAAVAKKAVHAWDLQFPALFAESVQAWIEQKPQPHGIELLT